MPPIRSQINSKPVKTERTHEENQERAYIAASRRSDRSLEARIESARRASEIHKKRTGRGLRVTEQDVINEEMYEEEDDDLPQQYRRLQAYMAMANTNHIFDGRLNSYLLSSMATRNMANNGFMNPNMATHQPTPFFPYNPHQSQPATPSQLQSPTGQTFSGMQPPQQVQQQQRSASTASAQSSTTSAQQQTIAQRRMSANQSASPVVQSPGQAHSSVPSTPTPVQSPSINQGFSADAQQFMPMFGPQQSSSFANNLTSFDYMNNGTGANMYGNSNMNFLSSTLPVEAQQMFGMNAFDPSSFGNPYLMDQSHGMPVPVGGINYKYNPNGINQQKLRQNNGMNQTLSPSDYPLMGNPSSPQADQLLTTDLSALDKTTFSNSSNDFADLFDSEGTQ